MEWHDALALTENGVLKNSIRLKVLRVPHTVTARSRTVFPGRNRLAERACAVGMRLVSREHSTRLPPGPLITTLSTIMAAYVETTF